MSHFLPTHGSPCRCHHREHRFVFGIGPAQACPSAAVAAAQEFGERGLREPALQGVLAKIRDAARRVDDEDALRPRGLDRSFMGAASSVTRRAALLQMVVHADDDRGLLRFPGRGFLLNPSPVLGATAGSWRGSAWSVAIMARSRTRGRMGRFWYASRFGQYAIPPVGCVDATTSRSPTARNPNGSQSSSPGLQRLRGYLGSRAENAINPQRG